MDFFESIAPASTFSGQPLSNLLNQIFYIGLGIAVILAIVMIVRGGIQYMTIDAASSKDSGKKMVQAALGGLVLAFAAILILNTINPKLTELNLSFTNAQVTGTVVDQDIMNSVAKYTGLTQAQYEEMVRSGKIPTDISPTAQKILAEAMNTLGFQSSTIKNTEAGNKACAAVVNMIIRNATGQEAGGGLSTAAMKEALATNSRFVAVPGGLQNSLPGDIVLSPTVTDKNGNSNVGHTGIVTEKGGGQIIQNRSAGFVGTGSGTNWNNYYGTKKGLEILIYRPL
jgi:hypothetical protein